MSDSANLSMTPPLTPPIEFKGGDDFDSDSLDYMDFFNTEMETSPLKEQVEDPVIEKCVESGPFLLSCKGDIRWMENFIETSCIGRKVLSNVLHQKNPCPPHSVGSEYVYHLPCTADNVHFKLDHYFLCIRQGVAELERGAQSTVCLSQSCHDGQYPTIRQDVAKFFNCLISHVYKLGSESTGSEEFLKIVIAEILDLLVFMGPLHDLQEHVTSAGSPRGNKCLSAAYHLLHLHLDVRWWSLVVLHIIESTRGILPLPASHPRGSPILISETVKMPSTGIAGEVEQTAFEQLISMVIWDLIGLMCREGLKKSIGDLHQLAGFSCTCSLELGVMVLHLIEHRHTNFGKKNFWDHMKSYILITLKIHSDSVNSPSAPVQSSMEQRFDVLHYPPPLAQGIKLPHIWWIFTHFSRLYCYDNIGKVLPPKSVEIKSETKLLRTLVKLSFGEPRSNQQPTEMELRFFVRSCLILHHLWSGERSSEWASSLWDYFSKMLDSNFLLPGSAGLEGLACMSKTAGGWLEQVKSRLPEPEVVGKNETSWQMFLRIVVGVVQSSPMEWRQMRGRIYSKFHGRKMLELSPMGLHNSITLFLCLAKTTDMADVTNKLGELLAMTPTGNVSKTKVVWRGFFATMLLLIESGCNISTITEKIIPTVSNVCQEYITSRDAIHRRELGQLIILYVEGMQEIFEHSTDLSLAQHSLICNSLSSVLQHCGITEMKAILLSISAALNKVLRNSEKLHCLTVRAGMDIVEIIWKEFGNFIKSQANVLTPPSVLGSVAASLTFCLAQHSQNTLDGFKESACGLFTYFTNNEAVNVTCSQQYIYSLLSEPNSITKISQVCPSSEVHLISSWLSALVTLGDTEELLAITPLVTSLPDVAAVVHQHTTCPFVMAKTFVKGIGKKFSEMKNFGDRMAFRDTALQYFSTLEKAYGVLLKKLPPPDYLASAVDLFACIMCHCHSVIYIKFRPTCPLPSLISTVVLPTNIYSNEKPMNPVMTNAMTEALPKVIRGLGSISISQDPYVIRCLKDIFTHYIYRFPVKSSKNYSIVTHPFIICLHETDIRQDNLLELRSIFLEVVRDNYIEKSSVSHVHHQIVISLLMELLEQNPSEWVTSITTTLISSLLELLLNMEDQVTKRAATDILQKLLIESQERNSPPRDELVRIIRKFVLKHVSWSSHRLFRILGVIGVISRLLVVDCLSHIAYAVRITEEKRGTGLDHTLRQGYQNLLNSLGVNEEDIEEVRLNHSS